MIVNSSIAIILRQYKEEHISEEEAIQLINDLTYRPQYIPYYTPWWNNVTWEKNKIEIPKYGTYKVTCEHENH